MEIDFKYFRDIDKQCERETGNKVSLKSVKELGKVLPVLQTLWDLEAPTLYHAIKQVTGKSFIKKRLQGLVFICYQPSFSIPLKLWGGAYLPSDKEKIRPHKYFVNLVLHEIQL